MPSFQTIATLFIIAGAAFLLVRRIYNSLKKSGSAPCGCGCSGCHGDQNCEDSQTRTNF
jgi:hypothetical protein